MDARQQNEETHVNSKRIERIREGNYFAEFEITLHDDPKSPWSPYVDMEDIKKTDRIRLALRQGDLAAAAKEAHVFELHPVAAE
jgi:hypothetical protein